MKPKRKRRKTMQQRVDEAIAAHVAANRAKLNAEPDWLRVDAPTREKEKP